MAYVRKVKGTLVKVDIDDYLCEDTYLFYDIVTGCIRIADGTVGGKPACIEGGAGSVNWGTILGDITNQTDLINYIDSSGGDAAYIRSFIGKGAAGAEFPLYSSTNQITQNAALETTIGQLDLAIGLDIVGNTIVTAGDSTNHAIDALASFVETNNQEINASNITTLTTLDSVAADTAKWIIRAYEVGTPTNVYATEIIATHDGTNVDFAKYAILKLGSNISGLDITITLTGGNTLNVNVVSTAAVNVMIKRIMAV